MAKMKADLFAFFDAMNRGDFSYVDMISDDEVKGLSPYLLTMWVNGATSNTELHVLMTDNICNDKVFTLHKHPRLLLKLFISANSGIDKTRYKFKKNTVDNKVKVLKCIELHYGCSLREAKMYKSLLSDDDLKDLEEVYGNVEGI